MIAQSVAPPRRAIMATFAVDSENNITSFGSAEEAAAATAAPFDSFSGQNQLDRHRGAGTRACRVETHLDTCSR
jgi:hypothetical protein